MQVLQRSVDKELALYSDLKDRTSVVARVMMLSLTSQPVDHDDQKKMRSSDAGQYHSTSQPKYSCKNGRIIQTLHSSTSGMFLVQHMLRTVVNSES